jgi:hypothetical protein
MSVQAACDRCTQGVMDADQPGRPGNDHLSGRCPCPGHQPTSPFRRTP